MKVFLLMQDADQTTWSQQQPIGVAVTTEEEAKRFVGTNKYGRSYEVIEILDRYNEGNNEST